MLFNRLLLSMFWSSDLRDGYGVACLPDEGAFFFLAAPSQEEQEGCQWL